jgi:hypothetical protein
VGSEWERRVRSNGWLTVLMIFPELLMMVIVSWNGILIASSQWASRNSSLELVASIRGEHSGCAHAKGPRGVTLLQLWR